MRLHVIAMERAAVVTDGHQVAVTMTAPATVRVTVERHATQAPTVPVIETMANVGNAFRASINLIQNKRIACYAKLDPTATCCEAHLANNAPLESTSPTMGAHVASTRVQETMCQSEGDPIERRVNLESK
eukprot:m.36495 g.36495  ORF g.36495 m.36495 type:complete len:130 (-) comp12476_c1_seq2:1181-1570(-)